MEEATEENKAGDGLRQTETERHGAEPQGLDSQMGGKGNLWPLAGGGKTSEKSPVPDVT